MRTNIGMCLAAILFILSASPVAAQSPAGAQDDGGQTGAGEPVDRPDRPRASPADRKRAHPPVHPGRRNDGGREGGGFSKQNWTLDEGVVGIAIAGLGLAAFIEPMTWRDLEVRTTTNGLTLQW